MKTIEQKAKAYDKALSKARIWQNRLNDSGDKDYADELNYIFPELAESDGENIRKSLLRWLQSNSYTSIAGIQINDVIDWLKKQGEQTPAWSGEDERICQSIMDDTVQENQLDSKQINWIKSLKSRVQSQEWSEEDKSMYTRTLGVLGKCYMGQLPTKVEEELNWLKYRLKYLILQNQWKPSEEQMKVLDEVLNFAANHENLYWNYYIFGTLNNLIRQLKKLKEE